MHSPRIRKVVGDALLLAGALALLVAVVALVGDSPYLAPRGTFALLPASLALVLVGAGVRLRRPAASAAARTGRIVLFEAPLDVGGAPVTAAITIRGPRDAIERFIPLGEFGPLFGGYAIWQPAAEPIPELPGEALGVWGRRTCSRFRRILRERGATVEVRRERGPAQSLARWSQTSA